MSSELAGFIVSICIGWIAFILALCGVIPQSVKVYKTKDTQSISLIMYVFYCVGCVIWIIWSIGYTLETWFELTKDISLTIILLANFPTLFLNIFCLIFSGVVLYIKSKNLYFSKKLKISEREYLKRTKSKKQC